MRVFVYEYLTARGIGADPADPLHAMHREGRAMRDAVAADFATLGHAVRTLDGVSEADEPAAFAAAAAAAGWSLVVAPEFDGTLAARCRWVLAAGGRLLGPSVAAVELCADKLTLAGHWRDHGITTPATTDRAPTACEAFPVVWKPRDGCGSTATFLLRDSFDVARARAADEYTGPMILQEYVPGLPASVAFLCGPGGNMPLLPTAQHLSDDGRFHYSGGALPLAPNHAGRTLELAGRALGCVPDLCGYVGVDLILGDTRDVAVEINPRLTTSYIGLRALAADNLAGRMLRAAAGDATDAPRWRGGGVRFTSDGVVTRGA